MGCSDRLAVLDGMPGAGKTTVLTALTSTAVATIGEYTSTHGRTLTYAEHPHVGNDGAHLDNWLNKATQIRRLLVQHDEWLVVDRDWLTALAYGHTTATLLDRAAWAWRHLDHGDLLHPAVRIIFDLDPDTSLARRNDRTPPGHPWADPHQLRALRAFYQNPHAALSSVHPPLARALATATRDVRIDATRTPADVLAAVRDALGITP